jgi:hypothetical protein
MARAAVWTCGLFGAALAICRIYPAAWLEPVVLFGIGVALLTVSARSGARSRRARALEPKEAAA